MDPKIEYVNTFVNTRDPEMLYNAFKYDGAIILVADNKSFDSTSTKAYLADWKKRVENRLEGSTVFVLDSALKSLPKAQFEKVEKGLDLGHIPQEGSYSGVLDDGYIYLRNNRLSSEDTYGTKLTLLAIVYECTDGHTGGPHSGIDKEELTKEYGCTKFQAKIF